MSPKTSESRKQRSMFWGSVGKSFTSISQSSAFQDVVWSLTNLSLASIEAKYAIILDTCFGHMFSLRTMKGSLGLLVALLLLLTKADSASVSWLSLAVLVGP